MKRFLLCLLFLFMTFGTALSQETEDIELRDPESAYTIFDDRQLLEGYTQRYRDLSLEILLEMIRDDTLTSYKMAGAVRAFDEKFALEIVMPEKREVERLLIRRMNRSDSPFVQVEIMFTLCRMDRYRYFQTMVPALLQKLNHYNETVNEITFERMNQIIDSGTNRSREARIVFDTLRNMFFLQRKRLENITTPGPKLRRKISLIRWSVKVLGIQELQKLPREVINLL